VISDVFTWKRTLQAQLLAPLFESREQYLSHMLENGVSRQRVRSAACILLHVVRLMQLEAMRPVRISEIDRASELWLTDESAHVTRRVGPSSTTSFRGTALRWFRFHNAIETEAPVDSLGASLLEFLHFQETKRLSSSTIRSHKSALSQLFKWAQSNHLVLENVTLSHVEQYLAHKRAEGCGPRTIASLCKHYRSFFQFAEERGLTVHRFGQDIQAPRVPRYAAGPQGPRWKDVRKLVAVDDVPCAYEHRSRAILLLLSIYGLRVSELTGLQLEDLDWHNETFIVRRAKRGRLQQFPLQFEVGEAILKYLSDERPVCKRRSLFLTLRPPYRGVGQLSVQQMVTKRMRALGIQSERAGPHSLRHSCATELLRKGASLRDIADFLGHRDMRSVSIYAKPDIRKLRKVAEFSLRGIR
jgi:site-specific recombinase XerD